MPVILEAIIVSIAMIFVFGVAFLALFFLAVTMAPIERGLSNMIWDSAAPKKPLPHSTKSSFKDFSTKH